MGLQRLKPWDCQDQGGNEQKPVQEWEGRTEWMWTPGAPAAAAMGVLRCGLWRSWSGEGAGDSGAKHQLLLFSLGVSFHHLKTHTALPSEPVLSQDNISNKLSVVFGL